MKLPRIVYTQPRLMPGPGGVFVGWHLGFAYDTSSLVSRSVTNHESSPPSRPRRARLLVRARSGPRAHGPAVSCNRAMDIWRATAGRRRRRLTRSMPLAACASAGKRDTGPASRRDKPLALCHRDCGS